MTDDIVMSNAEPQEASLRPHRNFVVAVDFGTTCSSVCYVGLNGEAQRSRIGGAQIETVDRFPSTPFRHFSYYDVPTEISYQVDAVRQLEVQQIIEYEDDSSSDSSSDDPEEVGAATGVKQRVDVLAAAPLPPGTVRWGYEVQMQFQSRESERENSVTLSRFKLMLDDSDITKEVRETNAAKCRALKEKKLIKEDLNVIADYLDQLFRWTKYTLESSAGWQENEPLEFVLCVPAVWTARACRRMQDAMSVAIKNSGLGRLQDGTVDNLFIVSEPEAAAACILEAGHTRLKLGERFVLLDAGGGTVDAITYEVERISPLRLKEIVRPGGALCGSSFINERFRKLLEKRLKNETYLEENGESLTQIIEALVVEFETTHKRRMDEMNPDQTTYVVKVTGLKQKPEHNLHNGKMILTSREIEKKLFRPSLQGVARVMGHQLDEARRCDEGDSVREVEKVILIGGFGQSIRLESHLRLELKRRFIGRQIELIVCKSQWSAAAIARGGVLRALRKEDGPARILQSSFGFLRTERYGNAVEHSGQKPREDKVDGHSYIDNTVDWVLSEGDVVAAEEVIERKVENTFGLKKKKLLCQETLVVSDRKHRSHYQLEHPENAGAEVVGFIEVDMTYLKDTGAIKKCPAPRPRMFPYWKVSFTLRVIVSGRNLRYEVIREGEEGVRKARQVSIAAAFRPGTD